jgi:Rho GDP-dissociation inhibitor
MASRGEDDLAPSKTEGFKVGEKKTLDEYAKLGMSPHKLSSEPLLSAPKG